LAEVNDPRAEQAGKLLSKTAPDVRALSALVTGIANPDDPGDVLSKISAIVLPSPESVTKAADRIEAARSQLSALGDERTPTEQIRGGLLADALRFYAESGDSFCPVCETGKLDAQWRLRVEVALNEADLLQTARTEADREVRSAELHASQLLSPPPPVIAQAQVELSTQAQVQESWTQSASPAPGPALSDPPSHPVRTTCRCASDLAGGGADGGDRTGRALGSVCHATRPVGRSVRGGTGSGQTGLYHKPN
jgi:hypothetical protein